MRRNAIRRNPDAVRDGNGDGSGGTNTPGSPPSPRSGASGLHPLSVGLLVMLVIGFAAGLLHLFNLRFEAGDVYPAYSSLRADPLGVRAFYDSLDGLRPVGRNFEPLTKLGDGRGVTLLVLGSAPQDAEFSKGEQQALETFVRSGGRLVIAFQPSLVVPGASRLTRPAAVGTNRPAGPGPGPRSRPGASRPGNSPNPTPEPGMVAFTDAWSVGFHYAPLERETNGSHRPAMAERRGVQEAAADSALPARLAVHTALGFEQLGPGWRILYERTGGTNDLPVVIERTLGGGAVAVFADAFPFSNEALRDAREPGLLAWSLGGSGRILFDETHLGTRSNPGIAAMARRYRLDGVAVALLVLAGLFLWRRSVSFLPPRDDVMAGERAHQIMGKESGEGFIQLLRRNIAPVDLLKVCLEQWNQTSVGQRPTAAKLEAMQRLIDAQNALEPRQRDPVKTYRQFCEILQQRRPAAGAGADPNAARSTQETLTRDPVHPSNPSHSS